MKVYGNVHFNQNYVEQMAIKLDTAFPASPVVGQLVFKSGILYICLEINDSVPVWCPLTNMISSHTHIQSNSASTWTVSHDLNTVDVNVMVYDSSNRVVIPNEVEIVDSSTVVVYLSSAAAGKVVVLSGAKEGQTPPSYVYEHYQTNPSTTWTIVHGLGRYPIVRAFIGNQEVQPATVTFDTVNQLTLTFSTAQVGQVKLI
jgi:hypothetical protein